MVDTNSEALPSSEVSEGWAKLREAQEIEWWALFRLTPVAFHADQECRHAMHRRATPEAILHWLRPWAGAGRD